MTSTAEQMQLYLRMMEERKRRRIQLHRELNDIAIEDIIARYEQKLKLYGQGDWPMEQRLQSVLDHLEFDKFERLETKDP